MFVDSLKKFGVEERFIRKLKTAGVDTMERLDSWMRENHRDHFKLAMTTGSERGAFEVLKGYNEFKKNPIPWGVIPTDYRKEVSSVIEINGERYYTRKETAKLLNVSLATLTRWKREGILVPVKISPRKVFYREEDIKKLLRKRG